MLLTFGLRHACPFARLLRIKYRVLRALLSQRKRLGWVIYCSGIAILIAGGVNTQITKCCCNGHVCNAGIVPRCTSW